MAFSEDAADVAAHAKQDGAQPGRIKFRDVNGDGQVTLADRTVIGSPHPDFTAGLDIGVYRGNWDLTATVFGSFGNDIFDEAEGVLRLPEFRHERARRSAEEFVDAREAEREVPAARM